MSVYLIIFGISIGFGLLLKRSMTSPARDAMHRFVRRAHGMLERNLRQERSYLVRWHEIELHVWPSADNLEDIAISAFVAAPPGPTLDLFHKRGGPATAAPPELEAAWKALVERSGDARVRCDGKGISSIAGAPTGADGVEALADLVSRIARLDDGLTETLLALPGASALEGHALVPGVVLSADGLLIGVRNREHVVAQLDDVTHVGPIPAPTQELVARAGDGELLVTENGARFTWKGIERDPAKLRAGIDALRSLRGATGPYR